MGGGRRRTGPTKGIDLGGGRGGRPSAGALDAGGVGREGEWRIQGIHRQLTVVSETQCRKRWGAGRWGGWKRGGMEDSGNSPKKWV